MSSIYRSSHSGDNGIQKYKTFSLYSSPSPPPNVKKNGEKFSSFLLRMFLFTLHLFFLFPLPKTRMPLVLATLILIASSSSL